MNVTLDTVKDQDKNAMKFASLGMFAKGTVYVILGVLTAMAAFNMGKLQVSQVPWSLYTTSLLVSFCLV